MKLFKPIDKFSYIPKYICLLDGIAYTKEVLREENLPCDLKITKRLCLTTSSFNVKEFRDMISNLSAKRIYTDEDIFLKDIDRNKVWYLYQPLKEDGTLKIDDLSVLGRNTFIGKNEIVSENEIKKDNYAPSDSCNFDAFYQFVLTNHLRFRQFEFSYQDSIFEIKYYPEQKLPSRDSSSKKEEKTDVDEDEGEQYFDNYEDFEPVGFVPEEDENSEKVSSQETIEIFSEKEQILEPEVLLRVENVGKKCSYPFVLYFLKKMKEKSNEKVIQNFKITQGYLGK